MTQSDIARFEFLANDYKMLGFVALKNGCKDMAGYYFGRSDYFTMMAHECKGQLGKLTRWDTLEI